MSRAISPAVTPAMRFEVLRELQRTASVAAVTLPDIPQDDQPDWCRQTMRAAIEPYVKAGIMSEDFLAFYFGMFLGQMLEARQQQMEKAKQ